MNQRTAKLLRWATRSGVNYRDAKRKWNKLSQHSRSQLRLYLLGYDARLK